MARRFFDEQTFEIDKQYRLNERAGHHIASVLRMQAGETIHVFNGSGGEFTARIAYAKKSNVDIDILEFLSDNKDSPLSIHLAQAYSRGDRFDFAIQKATELGVKAITPLYTQHGEKPIKSAQLEKKNAALEKRSD